MKLFFSLIVGVIATQNNLLAAEAGMPQLDPKYWASQAFWLILIFTILYISISKFYLPKITKNLAKFFDHFNWKNFFLQIDPKWSETRKKHEIGET